VEQYRFEVAVVAIIFDLGNIRFGHFKGGVPKWRRSAKFFIKNWQSILISATAGRACFYGLLGVGAAFALLVHG
jgi:hypothetical protein